jgi:hypothetical protein
VLANVLDARSPCALNRCPTFGQVPLHVALSGGNFPHAIHPDFNRTRRRVSPTGRTTR